MDDKKIYSRKQWAVRLISEYTKNFDTIYWDLCIEIPALTGEYGERIINNDDRYERALNIWILCAAILSKRDHNGDAAKASSFLIDFYSGSPEKYDKLSLEIANIIIDSIPNDSNRNLAVTISVFNFIYPELQSYMTIDYENSEFKYILNDSALIRCINHVDYVLEHFGVP